MLYPMFIMVLLTATVGVIAVTSRIRSVTSGAVKIKYYRAMQGQDVSERITTTTRCFNNMFEVPVLFYVVCTLYISLQATSLFALILAWLFVVFRCVQAFIHLTHNNVLHRMVTFWLAFVCVLLLWTMLVLDIGVGSQILRI